MTRGSLSIIVPTLGRPSLSRTLQSIKAQLSPDDEVLVVSDGPRARVDDIVHGFGPSFRLLETINPAHDYGCSPRNLGLTSARNDYLTFMDDDDVYLDSAFQTIRSAIASNYEKLFIFRMKHLGNVLWDQPEIRLNNISTQMYCFPNRPQRLARWRMNPDTESGRGDDYLFAKETSAMWPEGSVLFMADVIAELTQHSYGVVSNE